MFFTRRKRISVTSLNPLWDILEDHFNFLSGDILISICIIAPKSDEHLLLQRPHQHLEQEFNKLIVVDPLITVSVDLLHDPITD